MSRAPAEVDLADALSLEVHGLRIAARAWGDRDGSPVLCLHGWLDNAATFDRLAPLLPPRLHLVCVDLPGHGWSDHRGVDACQHFIDYVPFTFGCADALGWDRFAILGHSMGGGIGALSAGTFPDRVVRLVAIEGLGPLTAAAEEAPERVAAYIEQHRLWLQSRARGEERAYAGIEEAAKVRMRQPNAPLGPEAAELLVRRGTEPAPGGGLRWRHDPRVRITSMLRLTEEHVAAFLGRISCPVLAIAADRGWPFPEEAAKARLSRVGDVRLLRVAGDHHVHLNAPETVASEIGSFLLGDDADGD